MKKRDVEFLYEIGTLRFIPRTWRQFLNLDFANLAEHTLRVTWIALIIAKNEKKVNLDKILKIALVHDICESRTGDVHYLSRQYTKRNEKLAITGMLKNTSIESEFYQLWIEYEERKSLEAKIVKDADNIDVDLELREQKSRGNLLPKKWKIMRQKGVGEKFFTKSAKKLWDSLHRVDPDAWHIKAPNRFRAGDLKTD
ncbi:MAG TPA: HD domain-containing protein [Patescibacteria group bacterium]|nr:HD domain-containing protein [Patescibacteria group bacterium]